MSNNNNNEIIFKSWLDTKYFTLLPQKIKDEIKTYGKYKIWIELANTSYYLYRKKYNVVILNTKTEQEQKVTFIYSNKHKIHKLHKHQVYYAFTNTYNFSKEIDFLKEVTAVKETLKKEYTKQKQKEYTNKVENVCKRKGITREEYVQQNKEKRQKIKEDKIEKNNIEITEQIIELGPLIKDIKDQADLLINNLTTKRMSAKLSRIDLIIGTCKSTRAFLINLNNKISKKKK